MMRFDEFVAKDGIVVLPVDMFAGFVVEVGVPPGWEPFDAVPGMRVWVCRSDPNMEEFCANAVLTMHRVEAALDAGDEFAMLAEQQLQSTEESRELRRELATATEGAGFVGALALRITGQLGTIDSVSRSRIIATEQETLIAQVTLTALHDSPAAQATISLTVREGAAAGGHGGVPVDPNSGSR